MGVCLGGFLGSPYLLGGEIVEWCGGWGVLGGWEVHSIPVGWW